MRFFLFVTIGLLFGCGGCDDLIDVNNFIDVNGFEPDVLVVVSDAGNDDVGG